MPIFNLKGELMSAIQHVCGIPTHIQAKQLSERSKVAVFLALGALTSLMVMLSAWSTFQAVRLYGAGALLTHSVYTLLLPLTNAGLLLQAALMLREKKAAASAPLAAVKTPIPGQCRFLVKEGAHVKKGEAICIIECMKMETALRCEQEGRVAKLCVQENAMVDYHQAVAYIAP